jgi:hypothetical protein
VTTTPGDLHATVQASLTTTTSVGVRFTGGWSIIPPVMPAAIGGRSRAPRVLSERLGGNGNRYTVSLEGLSGQTYAFTIRAPDASAATSLGAEPSGGGRATVDPARARDPERTVSITFPSAGANADGYTATTVTFSRTGAP